LLLKTLTTLIRIHFIKSHFDENQDMGPVKKILIEKGLFYSIIIRIGQKAQILKSRYGATWACSLLLL